MVAGPGADLADRVQLVGVVGVREQQRHGAERLAAEIAIEARGQHAHAPPDEAERDLDDAVVEELHLVDAHDQRGRQLGVDLDVGARADRDAAQPAACVRDHVGLAVAVVEARLEQQRRELGDLGAADAPQQLLALAREHGAADDVERTTAGGQERDHGGSLRKLSDVVRAGCRRLDTAVRMRLTNESVRWLSPTAPTISSVPRAV